MKTKRIVEELEDVAQRLGYQVRTEKGNFRGGLCTIEGEAIIMLNRRHLPETQVQVLAEALRDAPLDTIYLKPVIRRALEDAWAQSASEAGASAHAD